MSLQKTVFTTQEATSLDTFGGDWSVTPALDISLGVQDDLAIDLDTTVIILRPDLDIYVLIDDGAATAIDTSNDMVLNGGGGEVYSIKIPKGIQVGNPTTQLHLHVKPLTSVAAQAVRVVEQ
jgi:hypothetical protein